MHTMKKPRTLAQLKAHPLVSGWEDETDQDNGYWIHLQNGYWSPETETTTLHEMTVKDLLDVFSRVEKAPPSVTD
tara:strand:- start:419 stop:643 length:225 start_codon:yes stop_codon:yes gene_type:complete